MTPRAVTVVGALLGFLGVAFGAFGAHGLKARVSPEMLEIFKTGAHYQLVHAVVLLVLGALAPRLEPSCARWAGILFTAGVLVFSGSLYALVFSGNRQLGAITPLGGVLLLSGWLTLAFGAWRAR